MSFTKSYGKKTQVDEPWCTTKQKSQKKNQKTKKEKNTITLPAEFNSYISSKKTEKKTHQQQKINSIREQIEKGKMASKSKKENILQQIKNAEKTKIENEIQDALDEWEVYNLNKELYLMDYISYVESDVEILNFMNLTNTPSQVQSFQDFVQEYDLGLFLDIEFTSDKDWYVVCPMCKWSIYPDVEEHTCTCTPVMIKGEIYYPAKCIPV